jgi:hypothetical protein
MLPHLPKSTMYSLLDYEEVAEALRKLALDSNGLVKLEVAGKSRIGRNMLYATVGNGPIKVWVQARGRAVQALTTPGALETIKALTHDAYADVREKITVTVIPLFVPDVDENWLDYTVDGVDLERDWEELRAPESKVWFDLWKKLRPDYAINLHQMCNWPFVEGTADICAFQAFANLLVPGEEMSAEQWDTNRRIGALAADAVRSIGVHPGKFWNHRKHHDAKPRRLHNLGFMLRGLPLDDGTIHKVRGAVYFEVRKNGNFEAPKHVRNPGDDELVRIFPAAVLGVLVALAAGTFDQVSLEHYEELPTGTMYTVGGTKPDWLDSGVVPDWVKANDPPQWLLDSFASFARTRSWTTIPPAGR